MRNDDVISGLSGLTCEINNSDAEGRVVLADGVAHATALPPKLPGLADGAQPTLVVDMATLTGAQLIATGSAMRLSSRILMRLRTRAVKCGSGLRRHGPPFTVCSRVLPQRVQVGGRRHEEQVRRELHSNSGLLVWSVLKDQRRLSLFFVYSVKDRSNAQSSCAANFVYEHPPQGVQGRMASR